MDFGLIYYLFIYFSVCVQAMLKLMEELKQVVRLEVDGKSTGGSVSAGTRSRNLKKLSRVLDELKRN